MTEVNKSKLEEVKPIPQIRRLVKAGSTRYLAVGTLVPAEWSDVKVSVELEDTDICIIKLENIR